MYDIIRIEDLYETLGEKELRNILKDFECSLNKDVEYFLKEKAIEFFKLDISQTFIVTCKFNGKTVIVGYFALTNKVTKIRRSSLSNNWRKRVARFTNNNDTDGKYFSISLPLIGQLGKNYKNNYNRLISGDTLLKLACDKIKEAQKILGGKMVYLECEDKQPLKDFYEKNGFNCFGKRCLDRGETDKNSGDYLLQMLCYLDDW